MLISEDDAVTLVFKIENEGLDYALDGYSSWPDIEDRKFHELRDRWIAAKRELEEYVQPLIDQYGEDSGLEDDDE